MIPGLKHLLASGKKLSFVSPTGTVLTRADDKRSMSDILGLEEQLAQSSDKKQRTA